MLDLASIRESANQAIPLWAEDHNDRAIVALAEPPLGRPSYSAIVVRQYEFSSRGRIHLWYGVCQVGAGCGQQERRGQPLM